MAIVDHSMPIGHHSVPIAANGHTLNGARSGGGNTFENEKCPVCGDKVSGYHYGLLTCESCKVNPSSGGLSKGRGDKVEVGCGKFKVSI